MTPTQIQKVIDLIERHWTPATQSRLDAKREVGRILDAALSQPDPEPTYWMTWESKYRLEQGGNAKGAVPVHAKRSSTAIIPLYTSPPAPAQPADSSVVWHSVGELEQAIKDAARWRFLKSRTALTDEGVDKAMQAHDEASRAEQAMQGEQK